MLLKDIIKILDAEVITQNIQEDLDIHSACGSDLMSDVLAYVKDQGILLTGLVNSQVVRTAEMMDIRAIIFVRGKRPEQEVIELAQEHDMQLLCTPLHMFSACGKLYEAGLGKK